MDITESDDFYRPPSTRDQRHHRLFENRHPKQPRTSDAGLDKSLSPRLLLTLLARWRACETMTAEKDSGCANRNASKFSGASCLAAYNTPHHFSRSLTPVAGSLEKCRSGECQIEPSTRIGFPTCLQYISPSQIISQQTHYDQTRKNLPCRAGRLSATQWPLHGCQGGARSPCASNRRRISRLNHQLAPMPPNVAARKD
jgi:hypothetical protein